MKLLLILVASLALTACGGDSGSKSLFSTWTGTGEYSDIILDFSGYELGESFPYNLYVGNEGDQCVCDLLFTGNGVTGRMILNNCYYDYNSGNNADIINCNALNSQSDYTVSNNTLTICQQNDCDTMR